MHRSIAVLIALAGSEHALAGGPFPPVLELLGFDATSGFVLEGIDSNDRSGHSVSSAGDLNGDGFADLLIGAYLADPDGYSRAGECYVVFGGPGVGATGRIELERLDGTDGFVLHGVEAQDRCGFSVSCAGDVNGDGFDDLIIGAYDASTENEDAGETYIVFGGAGVGSTGLIKLSGLDGTDGFVLRGVDAFDRSGQAVASAGDVNGDGFGDVVIGAPSADPNGQSSGEAYVVFGGATIGAGGVFELSGLDGANGFTLNGAATSDFSGLAVSSAGDLNGDGFDDVIIGAAYADPNAPVSGASYVVFGGANVGAAGTIELGGLSGADGFVLNGAIEDGRSGQSVSAAGDVNGDGVDDVIIGAWRAAVGDDDRAGTSYAVFGSPGIGASGSLELAALDGTNGFVLNGIERHDYSGIAVTSAGDVNGDGVDDLFIGASGADPGGYNRRGENYVVYGGAGVGAGGVFELSALDGSNGFVINGAFIFDQAGEAIASAGDVNGDGIDDLIIGVEYSDPGGIIGERAGETYVVFGRSSQNPADFDGSGCVDSGDLAVLLAAWDTPAGDLNGDNVTDSADLAVLLAAWGTGCE